MHVEMSLAEMLINAIAHGKIPGVQFKRGWSNDKATFDGLNHVIKGRLGDALKIAREQGIAEAAERPIKIYNDGRRVENEAVLSEIGKRREFHFNLAEFDAYNVLGELERDIANNVHRRSDILR